MNSIALIHTHVRDVFWALHRFVLILLLFVCHVPLNAAGMPLEDASHAVWQINNYGMKVKPKSDTYFPRRASAFAISPNTFLTSFHFFRNIVYGSTSLNDLALIQEHNSRVLKVNRLLSVSATYDLVLFEIRGSVENYLNLAEYFSVNDSHHLSVLGYLDGSAAEVQSVREIKYEDLLSYGFPTDRGNLSGMSGGPALNERGEVVGVAYTTIDLLPYLLIIKTEHIQKFTAGGLGLECSSIYLKPCILRGIDRAEDLAQRGDPIAQYQLASQSSKIALKNPPLALLWLKESAQSGFAPSQNLLGNKYYKGEDNIKKDFETAFYWYEKGARQNDFLSQRMLGNMYYDGHSVEKNLELFIHWFQKAANLGDSESEEYLKKHMPNQVKRDAYARTILKEELTLLEEKLKEKMRSRFPGCVGSYDPCGVLIEGLMEGLLYKGL